MTAARIIEAIGSLLWPLLVAVLVWRLVPLLPGLVADLRHALRTRAFSVRVGAAELSVEEATELLRRQVTDLQRQVESQVAAPAPAPAEPATCAMLRNACRMRASGSGTSVFVRGSMPRMPATNTKSPARVPRLQGPVGVRAPGGARGLTPRPELGFRVTSGAATGGRPAARRGAG